MIFKFNAYNLDIKQRTNLGYYLDIVGRIVVNSDRIKVVPYVNMDDKDGEELYDGDIIQDDGSNRPMLIRTGEYNAGRDDWGVEFRCTGTYVQFHDGGQYSLTQNEEGYCIAASLCKKIGNIYCNPELFPYEVK